MTDSTLRQLAQRGAAQRIAELVRELQTLRTMFPALRGRTSSNGLPRIATPTENGKPHKRKARKAVHWTQRPENAARVRQMAKRSARTRQARTNPPVELPEPFDIEPEPSEVIDASLR